MTTKRAMDPRVIALRKVEAQEVQCPRCPSAPGVPCTSIDGKQIAYHPERWTRRNDGW